MNNANSENSGSLPFPYGNSSSDEELRAAVLNSMHWHPGVPQNRIRVIVENGNVCLVGSVDQDYQRELAQTQALAVAGVSEVRNLIEVAPEPSTHP